MVDGQVPLAALAVMMVVVAALMLRRREPEKDRRARLARESAPALVGPGLAAGALSGFLESAAASSSCRA